MIPTAALVLFVVAGAADVTVALPSLGDLPPLSVAGSAVPLRSSSRALAANTPMLDAITHPRSSFGSALAQSTAPAASTTPATTTAPAPDPGASSAAPDANASTAPAEEEPDIEMLRHRARVTRTHRPLGIAAWTSLLLTEAMGTVLALNLPTAFGNGQCTPGMTGMSNPGFGALSGDSSPCIFGQFGSSTLVTLHEVSAFITLGFYGSAGVFALSMPDPEHASVGDDTRASRLRWHKRLAVVHAIGMLLEPILGIIAYDPSLIGISAPGVVSYRAVQDFQADMRTVHMFVGYVTFAALSSAMILELLH